MEINPNRLYKLKEVGAALHLSSRDVARLVDAGKIHATRVRPNSHPRITGKSILLYIENQSSGVA